MALSKITAASITDNTITNTQINSSAAIAQSKMAALAAVNMPAGSILQAVHDLDTNSTTYSASSSASGHDILSSTLR